MEKYIGINSTVVYILLGSMLCLLLHFYFFHGGYLGYDELEYAYLAQQLLDGSFTHGNNLYAHRYAGFVPLALSYVVFGIDDFANFSVTLLTLLSLIFLILKMLPTVSTASKWLAALLMICHPIHLLYLEKPMPDIIVSLGFLLCFYGYYQIRFVANAYPIKAATLFITGAILTFLAKETFLIFYPYFLALFLSDLLQKQRWSFWKWTLLGGVSFLAIYLLSYQIFLGDAFARIEAIFTNRYLSACTYEIQPTAVLLQRIAYALWLDFVRHVFLLPLIFVPMLWKSANPEIKFLTKSWLALLLLSNFMTISYTQYVPLCNDVRHFLFTLPVGAILFAHGLTQLPDLKWIAKIWMAAVILSMLCLSLIFQYENTWYLYLPMLAGLALHHFLSRKSIFYVAFAIGLCAMFIQNARYHLKINHHGQKQLIAFVMAKAEKNKWVITDGANTNIGNFYARYDTTSTFFISFKAFQQMDSISSDNQYLILNGMTMYFANQQWQDLPDFAKTAHEHLPKLFENSSGVVYKIVKQ
jgi:hypothetical protein